jgi:CheY-like chemotaxis protein
MPVERQGAAVFELTSASTKAGTNPPSGPAETSKMPVGQGYHQRIHDTARSIEDRIRRVLVPPDSPIATLRFLVVDDQPDAADALAAVLELLGCTVRTSFDAPSAMVVAGQFDPHVCLLDLKMPGMDGFELAGHLRVTGGGKRLLIATTALGDSESREKSQAAGFHLHLVKPIDVPTLIDAISRLWDIVQKQSQNHD